MNQLDNNRINCGVGRLFSFAKAVPGYEESERETHDLHELEYVHSIALLSIRFPQGISIYTEGHSPSGEG